MRIALAGFGEVGRAFGEAIAETGAGHAVAAFDAAWVGPPELPAGIEPRASVPDLVRDADLVLAAVPGSRIVELAELAAPALPPQAIYADLGSAHPDDKRRAAALVGDAFVDVAIVSPPLSDGLATKLYASGPRLGRLLELAAAAGLDVAGAGPEVGQAARLKIVRSVVTKGIEALLLEGLAAAAAHDLVDPVLDSLGDYFDTRTFATAARQMVGTNERHAGRRAKEAGEAARLLEEQGIAPVMTGATVEVLTIAAGAHRWDGISPPDLERSLGDLRRHWERAAAGAGR